MNPSYRRTKKAAVRACAPPGARKSRAASARSAPVAASPVPVARAVLSLGEPTPMRELAGRLRCDPSWVTSLADDLERRGLAERTADPSDRRVKVLRLTGEGAAVRDRLAEAVARESTVMRRLDGGDRSALEPLLRRLLDD
jgi:DNA-binding MarR family transcriptional regulator